MLHPFFEVPVPTIIGHRGAAGEAPANTIASFRLAAEQGAHILESDVQLTADGVAVLAHDPVVDAVTEARGAIADMSFAELRALDAGHRFTQDAGASFPMRGQGHEIPSLEAALAAFPRERFNLELKARAALGATLRAIEKFDCADRTLLAAEDDATMKEIRDATRSRGLPTAIGASVGEVVGFVRAALEGRPPPEGIMALQIPTEFAGNPLITPPLISHAHAHHILVHAWTINEPDEMTRLLELGVDGIVTDFPSRMVELLEPRG
jgi:glycerophosphoryl diester phosphodiesterase